MTAYRSTNTYRQDLLRYDGTVIVNVTVTPAVIAGTSTAPAVTVTEGTGVTVTPAVIAATSTAPAVTVSEGTGVTVTPAVIAATAALPAVTVEILLVVYADTVTGTAALPAVTVTEGAGVTVNATTVSVSGLIPEVTVSEGTGVTVTPAAVAATSTVPDPTITEGAGVTVARPQIAATSTVPSLDLSMRYVPTIENILPQIDVVPYHTNDPARRLARFRTPGGRGRNIFILTSGTVTTRQPGDPTLISRTLLGGHESPTDLTSEELDALVGAGFTVEVR
jgi:hypothetical protein